MSHSRYRILWIVGCLLFVVGCTAVQGDVEPPAEIEVDTTTTTIDSELSNSTIAESVEVAAVPDAPQTVIDTLKANLTSQSLASLDYSVPEYSLPDCAFSLEDPIELTYSEEGDFILVEKTMKYPHPDTSSSLDHVEWISSNEILAAGSTTTNGEWIGIYDLLSNQFETLYEPGSGAIRNVRWSQQHNGIFFIERGSQLQFLHRSADAPHRLYEKENIHNLEVIDQGQRLFITTGAEDRFALSVDTTTQDNTQKAIDIPMKGIGVTWSPNNNFLLTAYGHRSNESTFVNSLLYDLTNNTSCVLNLKVPGVIGELDFERRISDNPSWSSDERYTVFNTRADFDFRTSKMIIADMDSLSLKTVNLDNPDLFISDIKFLPNHENIAVAAIADPSKEEINSIYFIDFEKQIYWEVSSRSVVWKLKTTFIENPDQLAYGCFQLDGKGSALCHAAIEETP